MRSETERFSRVLLIGFMASGKSTVGRELARLLDWDFVDFDAEIERRSGIGIPEIFARHGEPTFRRLEHEIGLEHLARDRVVLASGGGWAVAPGRLDEVPPETLVVWLKVGPATAVARARLDGVARPLLEGPDPVASAFALSRERESAYARARLHLDGEAASPHLLAETIAGEVRGPAG